LSIDESVLDSELQQALAITQQLPHRESDREGFYFITSSPTNALMEQMGAELGHARYLVRHLTKRGFIEFVRLGGDRLHNGRRGHAWLVKMPEQPDDAMEDAADIAEFNADMLRIAGAVQELEDRNLELIHRVQELESVETENLRLHTELATATSTISALNADKARLEGLLTGAQQQLDECMRNVGRLQIPETLRKLIKDKKN